MIMLAISVAYLCGQTARTPVVEFEMMTWAEVKKVIHEQGKINAIVYNVFSFSAADEKHQQELERLQQAAVVSPRLVVQ